MNTAFERISGYRREELIGRTIHELGLCNDRRKYESALERGLAAGALDDFETECKSKSGKVIQVLLSARFPAFGDRRCALISVTDVTARKQLEEQLRRAQKMEAVGRLAGGVAHDFNNILTVILSTTEAIRGDLAESRGVQAEDVDEIRVAARRAAVLTQQLLSFARKHIVAPAPIDLNDVVTGTEQLLRRVIGEDVALEVSLAPALGPVLCDREQLEHVILNLAVNARDAMPSGGKLTLETLELPDGGPRPGPSGWIALRVRDTGEGLSPEARAHLFEPFFTTKPRGKGTGLGLATTYGIVRQHGGEIDAESEPGAGTVFEVRLRRHVGPMPARSAPEPSVAARGSGTILIVEDERSVREVTAGALRAAGYEVLVAAGGAEALGLLARASRMPDLVVTDVIMPGMNGRVMVEEVRRRCGDVPALFVSGYTDDVIRRHGVLEPGVEFLPKPFTGATLLARVRAVLDPPAPGAPARRSASDPAPPSRAPVGDATRLRVLVVDDQRDHLDSAELLLVSAGHDVRAATGGEAALKALDGGFVPDVVILDLLMPDMDGATLLTNLRRRDWDTRPRFIVVTGVAPEHVERLSIDEEVLFKPYSPTDLLDLLASEQEHERRR